MLNHFMTSGLLHNIQKENTKHVEIETHTGGERERESSAPEYVESLEGELVRVGQLIGKSHFRFSLKPIPIVLLTAHQIFMKIIE